MDEKESFKTRSSSDLSGSDKKQKQIPYEGIASQVVTKIKNEPFLFVIAVTALLIGLVVLAAGLGSPDLRFIVIVIALLAFVVILGHYLLAVLQIRRDEEALGSRPSADKATGTLTQAHGSKYNIHMAGPITSAAIGDNAKVEQQFGTPAQPVASGSPTASAITSEEQRTSLEQQLSQHQRNLARLHAQKSVYAAGEEPLSLLNKIEAEERAIQRIQGDLEQLTRGCN